MKALTGRMSLRDGCLFGGIAGIGAGVGVWLDPGLGVAASGACLYLVGVFGIAPTREET